MNARVANFINRHEEEIDSNDFHAVFTAAYAELNNDDTKVLFNDLCDTFDKEDIVKQRETALYFITSMITEAMDPNRRYTFAYVYEKLYHYNILGLSTTELSKYIRDNADEFDLVVYSYSGSTIYRKKDK